MKRGKVWSQEIADLGENWFALRHLLARWVRKVFPVG